MRSKRGPGGQYPEQMGDAASYLAPEEQEKSVPLCSWEIFFNESDLLVGLMSLNGALGEGVSFRTIQGWSVQTLMARLAARATRARPAAESGQRVKEERLRREFTEYRVTYETLRDAVDG